MTLHTAGTRRFGAALLALTMTSAVLLLSGGAANAAIVPTVPLGTAANYSVLAGQTVTNSGPSVLNKSLGLWAGTSITGFPPGTVLGTRDQTNGAAQTAKSNLTAAYLDAAGRPVDETLTSGDLTGQTLVGGVYNTTANGPLSLTGTVTLDGADDPDSVWIFQTGSSLDFAGSSVVSFIRGASACNVFWQVGSSATLVSGATFAGNILALTSISAGTAATIQGRLLARNGSVTLLTNTFTTPTSAGETAPTPTPTPATTPGTGTTPTAADTGTGTGTGTGTTGGGTATGLNNGVPGVSGPPRTGGAPLSSGNSFPWLAILFGATFVGVGTTDLLMNRRARARRSAVAGASGPPNLS